MVINKKVRQSFAPDQEAALVHNKPSIEWISRRNAWSLLQIEVTILQLKEVRLLRWKPSNCENRGFQLGALTIRMGQDEIRPFDGDLIYLRKLRVSLPIAVESFRLIVLGHICGLVDETVVIAACLSPSSFFKVRSFLHSSPSSLNISFRSQFHFVAGTYCDTRTFLNVSKVNRGRFRSVI